MSTKVYGNIKDISRFSRVVGGVITLINGPISEDPALIFPTKVNIQTDDTGYFECTLGKGDYTLTVGTDIVQFSVTEDGEFNIVELLSTDLSYTRQPYSSQWNGILDHRHIQFLFVANPETPDFSLDSTSVPTGLENDLDYNYSVSHVTASGETAATDIYTVSSSSMTTPGGPYKHTVIPLEVSPDNVTAKRIWRTRGSGDDRLYLLAEVGPTVAEYIDGESNADFNARKDTAIFRPEENTTAGGMYADNVLLAYFSPIGLNCKQHFRLPSGATLGEGQYEREILIQEDGDGRVFLDVFLNGTNHRFTAGTTSCNCSFEYGATPLLAEYIGGRSQFRFNAAGRSADIAVKNRPLSGNLEIELEVDGTLTGYKFTVTPGSGEFLQSIDLEAFEITGGTYIRWKVTANSNTVEQSASGVSITMNVEVDSQ